MIRYLNSFLITSFLYSIIIGLFLFAYANQKIIEPKKIQKKKVSLKHIVLIKKEEKPKILEKNIIKPIQEVVKKEVIVEKALQKIKNIVNKEKPKRKKVKKKSKKVAKKVVLKPKKIVKKKIIKKKELVVPVLKTPVIKQKVVNISPIINYKENFLKKNLLLIKKQIQKHVKYSKRARKMNIQGNVIVQFKLSQDGAISNIKALSGHRMLRRSTIKAIEKAAIGFPNVESSITIKVPIEYKLI